MTHMPSAYYLKGSYLIFTCRKCPLIDRPTGNVFIILSCLIISHHYGKITFTAPTEPQFSLDLCEWVMIRSTDRQLVSVRCTSEHVLFLRWILRAGTCNAWWMNGLDFIRGDATVFVFMRCGLWFQMGSASVFSTVWEHTRPDRRCWDRCGSTETNEKLLLLWFIHILL